MRRSTLLIFAGLLTLLSAAEASAHFLFIRIGQHAEAGRGVEVFFSERAEAGDPKFVAKIAHTKLWMQGVPGEFSPLEVQTASDRLRAFLPAGGAVGVVGRCDYGVLTRDVSFLLEYYPKAIAGEPAKVNQLQRKAEIPFEIAATVEGEAITLVALDDGKPVPGVVFTTVDDDLANEELTADKSGRAVWKPEGTGHYCVYAKQVVSREGTHDGKPYTEIRRFATLAFEWPLVKLGGDEQAVELFQRAIAARGVWRDFPGFRAKIGGRVDGRDFSGTASVSADGSATVEIDEAAAGEWVDDQIGSIALHRLPSSSDGAKPVLRFADDDADHPLGRLLTFVGGSFASSYRVRDDQITVVNRNIGPQNFSILVLENERNAEEKYLPRSYVVQYWDAKTGRLDRTETFRNGWTRVGAFDLPSELTVTTASSSGLEVRSLRLTDHELLQAK